MEKSNDIVRAIGHIEIQGEQHNCYFDPDGLPILPTRNLVLFPDVVIPLSLIRESSYEIAKQAKDKNLSIGIVCQLDADDDAPNFDSICKYGVLATVVDLIKLPDGSQTALVKAGDKFKITGRGFSVDMPQAEICASVKLIHDIVPKENNIEFTNLLDDIQRMMQEIASHDTREQNEAQFILNLISDNEVSPNIVNILCTNLPINVETKIKMLKYHRLSDRAKALLTELMQQNERMNIAEDLMKRSKESLDDQQRRTFLQRQMDIINQELNGEENDGKAFRERFANLGDLPVNVATHIGKEINKLERQSPNMPDYYVQFAYLDMLLSLPWTTLTDTNPQFSVARHQLEMHHYGLNKVKERVLEQIAVMMYNPDGHAPILCLVGPPGVGKTSLGKSIANALGRKYERVSLGGLHDEAEIRGHRRTYVGAMPGRVIDAIKRAGTRNPLIVLDEIDKIGADYKGDPAAALLEVLDPEQNCRFHDNYIDLDFDLSQVLFIATANTLNGVAQPLIDRMEIIDINGYLVEEKIEIALRHLLPAIRENLKLSDEKFNLSNDAIRKVIESYTSESGVRQLDKALNTIARKHIMRILEDKPVPELIDVEHIADYLGVEKFNKDIYEGNDQPGIVTGLAWTAAGGEILFIETSLSMGKGEKLTLTGTLGDVMKESAMIALEYVRSHAEDIGIDPKMFETRNVHVHVPEGAIPKDGPSAGITMATSIASAFTNRPVLERLAMTGEITLRGKVLAVGGVREKILAARRAGITDIILSEDNRRHIEEIEPTYKEGLTFHFVRTVAEVLRIALGIEMK